MNSRIGMPSEAFPFPIERLCLTTHAGAIFAPENLVSLPASCWRPPDIIQPSADFA